jgi:hypothetical protein
LVNLELPLQFQSFLSEKIYFEKIPAPEPIVLDLVLLSIPSSGIKTQIESKLVFD